MDFAAWAVWGFGATVVLTGLMTGAQSLGLTRIDLPFVLGTMFTPNRDLARLLGILIHLVNGWISAIVYIGAFETSGLSSWWLGPTIGLVHGMFVVVVLIPALPGIHPRMASDTWGPEPTQVLEPPGALVLNYGRSTPIVTVLAHVVYGTVLGLLY
jgi:hypothetical protein